MDITSVIGILLGAAVLVIAIAVAGASFAGFVDYPSIMVVLGGAACAVLVSFPVRQLLATWGVAKSIFFNKQEEIPQLIEQIVSLAETARRDGLLALEGRLEELENPFVVLGIQMAVDGTRPEVIEAILRTEMDAVATRHRNGRSVIEAMGRYAPAFGMIGTLIGLIIMLGNMDDPSAIGPGMAVALITTLYGAILANLVFLPAADKLNFLNRHELLIMEIVVRGIMAIQAGDNPRVIEQKLSTFVPPKLRAAREAA